MDREELILHSDNKTLFQEKNAFIFLSVPSLKCSKNSFFFRDWLKGDILQATFQ